MPPNLALLLWFILLLGLLYFDPAKGPRGSAASWLAVIWISIASSRLPSQWFGGVEMSAADAYQEGNPIDRTIFSLLILLSLYVLISRSFNWGKFFGSNSALVAFLLFALASCIWSDFPLVAVKRWLRDLGNYLVILVVLSDSNPLEAVRTLLRRLSYLLIPLSIVLIKYFPVLGRQYSSWTGLVTYTGVTTTKDMLAVIALVSGIYFFWDTLARWPERRKGRTRTIFAVNFAFIGMSLWVLHLADSASCRVCWLFAWLVIAAAHTKLVRRHPTPLKIWIPLCACLSLFLVFGVDMKASIAGAVGRNATFTDRTLLWPDLIARAVNPLVGAGYESFWLGPRLEQIWQRWAFRPNQSHNGYIEIYLELGLIGGALLLGFLIASYRRICRYPLDSPTNFAPLRLALWGILPIYNITTSDFCKGELMWLVFLLGAIAAPSRAKEAVRSMPAFPNVHSARLPGWPLETTDSGRP
jgi:O-antigen ligase